MAGISAAFISGFIPLYFWGKAIRQSAMRWPFVQFVFWEVDREVGE